MATFRPIPRAIMDEVVRQQEATDWINTVPSYARLPDGRYKHYKNLTVADSEQLVEMHTRKAIKFIGIFDVSRLAVAMQKAAWNILRARTYRCLYFQLTGTDGKESDMPFPSLSVDDARILSAETGDEIQEQP